MSSKPPIHCSEGSRFAAANRRRAPAGVARSRAIPTSSMILIPPIARFRPSRRSSYWEQYGYWCFCRHADVSALLRDRRFGRQILHVASRESLGWPEPQEHLAPFNAIERHSLLELEPPEHTRLRGLVNRAFVSRQVERLAPRIEALANELIDGFSAQGDNRTDFRVRDADSGRRDRRTDRRPR